MKTFYLVPTNGRKSFGGKAIVEQNDNISVLTSYNTKVAHYDHNTNIMTVNGYYSETTATHINSFLNFYGFDTCNKKQLEIMRDFITHVFEFLLRLTALITLTVFVAWLFDCRPNNLYLVWKYCFSSLAVSFLFYLLFGGKNN